jgi:hypothetical protein
MPPLALDRIADVVDALTRGAPGAYAAEFGGAFDPEKIYYVCTKETWAAVVAAVLRHYPHGVPVEVSAMKMAFNPAMPLGRFDVGYHDHPGTSVAVEVEIPVLSFGDRARVDLVDAVRGVLPDPPGHDAVEATTIAATSTTWHLLFNADPRLPDSALPQRCLGCRVILLGDDALRDGVFVVRHAGAERVVEVKLT